MTQQQGPRPGHDLPGRRARAPLLRLRHRPAAHLGAVRRRRRGAPGWCWATGRWAVAGIVGGVDGARLAGARRDDRGLGQHPGQVRGGAAGRAPRHRHARSASAPPWSAPWCWPRRRCRPSASAWPPWPGPPSRTAAASAAAGTTTSPPRSSSTCVPSRSSPSPSTTARATSSTSRRCGSSRPRPSEPPVFQAPPPRRPGPRPTHARSRPPSRRPRACPTRRHPPPAVPAARAPAAGPSSRRSSSRRPSSQPVQQPVQPQPVQRPPADDPGRTVVRSRSAAAAPHPARRAAVAGDLRRRALVRRRGPGPGRASSRAPLRRAGVAPGAADLGRHVGLQDARPVRARPPTAPSWSWTAGSTNGSTLTRQGVSRQLSPGKPATLVDGDTVAFGDRSMEVRREA